VGPRLVWKRILNRRKVNFCLSRIISILTVHINVKVKVKVKLSLCLTKHHAMKANWVNRGIAPRIL
jgi:hypothetical protein